MTKGQKHDPYPLSWTESPSVEREEYWVGEPSSAEKQELVEINGALFTLESAEKVRDELQSKL